MNPASGIHPVSPADNGSPYPAWLVASLLAGAVLLAYANSFRGPFVFDDVPSIVENATILRLGDSLSPPAEGGLTVSGRPVLNLTLALNHAISGMDGWSYHALNLLIHLLAGLTLFGLVRRTLRRLDGSVGRGSSPTSGQPSAIKPDLLALVIAGLWLLHPLQTESVTYVIQRAESLMGLFFLLTLYAFARAVDSPRPRLWHAASFLACLLGVGTKEVMVLAPVMVFLYDRTFVSGSFRAAWQRHRWRHLTLVATWLPLAWLVAGTGGNRGSTMGFDVDVSPTDYWLTQFEAVTRYLGLGFWPHPLVFDYGKVAAPTLGEALPWALPVLVLVPATLYALWRRPVAGFLGAWFFGILAPTSIVPGELQMIVEHRMYLPLAAVIALVAGAAAPRLGRRGLLAAGAGLALAAGTVTWHRNAVYQDEVALWHDTIAKRPENARTYNNLGRYHYLASRWDEAIALFEQSLRLDPGMPKTHFNLGLAHLQAGRPAQAVAPLQTAVRILPKYFAAHLNLGIALTKLGRAEEAIPHFAAALRHDPWPVEVHFQWGIALARLGHWDKAIEHYGWCLRLNPRHAEAFSNWGTALLELKSVPAAIEKFEAALRVRPDLPEVHFNLGLACSALDRRDEAIRHYTEAVRLDPAHATAQLNLGIALAQAGRLPEAIARLEEVVRLQPASPEAHANLGVALSLAERTTDALAAFQAALRLRPGDAQVHYNVGHVLLEAGRWTEARPYFEEALRLRPDFPAARDILRRLQETGPR
jgi:tetratricopeptide (TPR) repeat protein